MVKAEADNETLAERATQLLQRDILSGMLPPGGRLGVVELSGRYGIGTTPIREALSRLASRDFIMSSGNRGFSVRPLSPDDLRDVTITRLAVEMEALRLAIRRGDDEWEASVVAALHRLQIYVRRKGSSFGAGGEEFDEVHFLFHSCLIAGCGSSRMCDLAASLYHQAYRYRASMMRQIIDSERFLTRHRLLAEAALGRDQAEAASLLRQHLTSTFKAVYPEEDASELD